MTSRIAELSSRISSSTKRIEEYLAANSLPYPSFDEDGPVTFSLSAEMEAARSAVLNAAAELQALLTGPDALLRPIVSLLSYILTLIHQIREMNRKKLICSLVEWYQSRGHLPI